MRHDRRRRAGVAVRHAPAGRWPRGRWRRRRRGDLHAGDGAHGDAPHGGETADQAHAGAAFVKYLSIKTVTAFFTFFGLTGLACRHAGVDAGITLTVALAAGAGSLFLVAYAMRLMAGLQASGNYDLANGIGQVGRVYLTIPPARTGAGKVTLVVQGRSVTCKAVTSGAAGLATGAEVKVIELAAPDTVLVVSAVGEN
ncbi:MAG: hypothetical protein HY719_14450 [Planctomycetes bacterium]|nr:hypothetical protein [Planctomycetota bacterium]